MYNFLKKNLFVACCFFYIQISSQSFYNNTLPCSNTQIIKDYAYRSNNLGIIGNFKQKLDLDLDLLSIIKSNCPNYKNDINYYDMIYSIAFDYYKVYEYEKSIYYNELNISELEKNHWTKVDTYLNSLTNLGESYFTIGNYSKAIENYNKYIAKVESSKLKLELGIIAYIFPKS